MRLCCVLYKQLLHYNGLMRAGAALEAAASAAHVRARDDDLISAALLLRPDRYSSAVMGAARDPLSLSLSA